MMIYKEQIYATHSFTFKNVISDAQTPQMILEKACPFCGTGKKYTKAQSKCSIISTHEEHSRYLRTMDNPKIREHLPSILYTTVQLTAFLESFKLCSPTFSSYSLISLTIQDIYARHFQTFKVLCTKPKSFTQCRVFPTLFKNLCVAWQSDTGTTVLFPITACSCRAHNMVCASHL